MIQDDDSDLEDHMDEEADSAQIIRVPIGRYPVVFSLPGSQEMTQKVMRYLEWQTGSANFTLFKNGEISVKVEQTVTMHDVFVIFSRNDAESEVNFGLMRLLLFIAAIKEEAPHRLTVVLPCLDYARQDRRLVAGEALPPKLLIRCLKTAGADRFLTVDLHNQAEAAFCPPAIVLDELTAGRYLVDVIQRCVPYFSPERSVVCATNGGGLTFTRKMAGLLGTGFIMADRFGMKAGSQGEVRIIGSSASDAVDNIIIVDDMFDTCGNLSEVCAALRTFAPRARLFAAATHGYFSGDAPHKVKQLILSGGLEWLAVTNSISQTRTLHKFQELGIGSKLIVVDISRLLAGAIARIHMGSNVNSEKFRSIDVSTPDPVLHEASKKLIMRRQESILGP